MTNYKKFNIAVVGVAFRLPGDISTCEELWHNLKDCKNLISTIDDQRFHFQNYLHPRKSELGKSYTFNAGMLSRIDEFDADFFGITPREAQQMDPQQRMLLETTWEALEHGGQNPEALAGSNCAVYIGIGSNEHLFNYANDTSLADSYTMLGNCTSIAANRISYIFDLHGPSMSIDTACSSSLVALHQACNSLWNEEASMAIAGGVNLLLSPTSFVGFSKASMLSPDGQCKSFAADGNGYVRSEGCIVLFLKPLAQAEKDGDPIHAIIVNSGVNSDGRTNGIALPNADAQAALITRVHEQADIAADDIQYIEAHGTGTVAGDRTEALALSKALAKKRGKDNPLFIGSIKSNLGHLEVASGLTGVLKVILCLKHKTIPATLYAHNPNPNIPFDDLHLKVVDSTLSLHEHKKPMLMGVNSFGFGGTNAHVVLKEYTPRPEEKAAPPQTLPPLLLSVHDKKALPRLAKQCLEFLESTPTHYYDLAYTLAHHRACHRYGYAIDGDELAGVLDSLTRLATQGESNAITEQLQGQNLPIAFVYSGNGSQWQGMAASLLKNDPLFKETLAEIDELFAQYADFSIKKELLASLEQNRYEHTEIAQPCIFAVQVAITQYLRRHGVEISAVTGHSIGEIAAAWASGALTLAQALEVVYKRSFWQGKTRGQGKMLAVALNPEEAKAILTQYGLENSVEIAGFNSAQGITLAGELAALEQIKTYCKNQGIFYRLLDLDYAFHTKQMDPIKEGLLDSIADLKPQKNQICYVSTVTGQELAGDKLTADYWWQNIREPVRFHDAINTLLDKGFQLFIEIGPHPILKPYIQETLRTKDNSGLVIQTLKRHTEGLPALKEALYRTWLSGGHFNKDYLFPTVGKRITLPPYPWVKESYWLTPTREGLNQANFAIEHPLLGRRFKSNEAIWENHLDTLLVPYLNDHQVDGIAVMPAAGYAEMALAASAIWYGHTTHDLRDIDILAPMILDDKACRLVRFELQPQSGHFLIKSCPRHSTEPWITHVIGRVIPEPTFSETLNVESNDSYGCHSESSEAMQLYKKAETLGLSYGPDFQTIETLWFEENKAWAKITSKPSLKAYLQSHHLYPGLLDACFQSLIGLLSQSTQETFLPVRIGRLQLFAPLPEPIQVTATIVNKSKQSVLAHFSIRDEDGKIVAHILDCRFKKTQIAAHTHTSKLYGTKPHLLSSFKATNDLSFDDIDAIQKKLSIPAQQTAHFATVMPLIDVVISHFIYETIADLAQGKKTFSLDDFLNFAAISPDQPILLKWCLDILVEDHFLQKDSTGQYTFISPKEEINAQSLWQLLIQNYPHYLTELLLIGRIGSHLKTLLQGNMSTNELLYSLRKHDTFKHFCEDIPSISGIHNLLCATVKTIVAQWPSSHRLRVLDIGYSVGTLTSRLINLCPKDKTDYYIAVADETSLQLEEHATVYHCPIAAKNNFSELDTLSEPAFDLIIIRQFLHEVDAIEPSLIQLQKKLAKGGVLLLVEQISNRLQEFILGPQPTWWIENQDGQLLSRLHSAKNWQRYLGDYGFQVTAPLYEPGASPLEGSFLLLAQTEKPLENHKPLLGDVLVLASSEFHLPFYEALQNRPEHITSLITRIEAPNADDAKQMAHVQKQLMPFTNQPHQLHLVWLFDHQIPIQESAKDCAGIIQLVTLIQNIDWKIFPRLSFVTYNALPLIIDNSAAACPPTASIIWGIGRVLQNEYPHLHLKLIDMQGEFTPDLAAHFAQELFTHDAEKEIILTGEARYGLRIDYDELIPASQANKDYRLDFKRSGSLNNLQWFPISPTPLADDEVMVKPQASGLNFRDLMYAMGLIPDEAVENGFLGTTLGMEFAGDVIATGKKVTHIAVGDRVMGFAPACFSSTTITKAHAITPLPHAWSYAEAATIPIAFFTAYYAIKHLAQLQPGEKILIHGAAGGVGIAAIQVAKHLGAEIYVTAGSLEKRDFLRLMGITHLYDSRTLAFADEIRHDTAEEGVDVILNCLAGEAIHANLSILKPFGRFLELGKRDFFANSRMELRPFRNNISYFGIDADQLLIKQPALCSRLFQEIMNLFAKDCLTPLPYREFAAEDIIDTFRYMQQSRHIGKIIVNFSLPPSSHYLNQEDHRSLSLSNCNTYLVTGGLSGFGLQTAEWLVKKGARHLVLVGRKGAASEEAKQKIAAIQAQGVTVTVKALDITNPQAVDTMINAIEQTSFPLKGIIHAAAIYDDALMQNLTLERMKNVLAPKVEGAWNLHLSTQGISLDFFILYSSVTTCFGNPGQANYVAANAYLESLALYRRSLGLSALSIAWGPITDAGYLARNEKLKNLLAAKMGASIFTADEALRWLEKLMISNKTGLAIAHLNIAKMQRNLPIINSPKFSNLVRHEEQFGELHHEQTEDIRALIVDKSPQEILAFISHILSHEIAKILRLPVEKIDKKESLLNIGMDSLVGAELANAIEQRFSLQMPMLALSQGLSVHAIAERIMGQLLKDEEPVAVNTPDISGFLHEAALHGEEISAETALEIIKESQEVST